MRRHDRERHVEKLHPGNGSEIGESSQETPVPSDMDIQEVDRGLENPPVQEGTVSGGDMVC